jgi:hypothetical protein
MNKNVASWSLEKTDLRELITNKQQNLKYLPFSMGLKVCKSRKIAT